GANQDSLRRKRQARQHRFVDGTGDRRRRARRRREPRCRFDRADHRLSVVGAPLITVITIIHLVACVFLILVVLLQTEKGAEMGAVFGGGSSATLFGASGAGNFLTK